MSKYLANVAGERQRGLLRVVLPLQPDRQQVLPLLRRQPGRNPEQGGEAKTSPTGALHFHVRTSFSVTIPTIIIVTINSEKEEKLVESWHESNGSVTYKIRRTYKFDRESSVGDLDQIVTTINMPMVVSISMRVRLHYVT